MSQSSNLRVKSTADDSLSLKIGKTGRTALISCNKINFSLR